MLWPPSLAYCTLMKVTKAISWPVGLELSAVLQQSLNSEKEQGAESFILTLPSAPELRMVEPDGEFWQEYQPMGFLPADSLLHSCLCTAVHCCLALARWIPSLLSLSGWRKSCTGPAKKHREAVGGRGGLGNDSFCWKSCLSLIKLKAAISTGFPVQHIVGMASRRSLPKEFSWLFQRSITLAISSFLVLFQLLKKNPLESTCGKKKHKGQKETKNNNEQQKRDIKGKINK